MATLELLHIGSCHRWQSKVHLTRVSILLTHCLPGKINWKSIVGGCRSDRRSLCSYCQYWLTPIHVIGFVFVIFFSMFSIFFLSPLTGIGCDVLDIATTFSLHPILSSARYQILTEKESGMGESLIVRRPKPSTRRSPSWPCLIDYENESCQNI